MSDRVRVTVWSENVHERKNPIVAQVYPDGMHNCIARGLREEAVLEVGTATLQEKEHGLTESVPAGTDVLPSSDYELSSIGLEWIEPIDLASRLTRNLQSLSAVCRPLLPKNTSLSGGRW